LEKNSGREKVEGFGSVRKKRIRQPLLVLGLGQAKNVTGGGGYFQPFFFRRGPRDVKCGWRGKKRDGIFTTQEKKKNGTIRSREKELWTRGGRRPQMNRFIN